MPINLKNNRTLTATEEVKNIINSFLKKLKLTFFGYSRIYDDGYRYNLSNRCDWVEHYFTNDYQNIARLDRHPSCYTSGCIIWDTWSKNYSEPQIVLKDMEDNFNIAHGLSIIKRCENYCDGFDFGASRDHHSINDFYLSNMDLFENFSLYFIDKAKDLMRQADRDRFLVTYKPDIDIYSEYPDTLSGMNNLKILDRFNKYPLTERELNCVDWLIKGKTAGELAMILGISERTAEKHIISIKQKLDCHTMFQLGNKISKLGLDKFLTLVQ